MHRGWRRSAKRVAQKLWRGFVKVLEVRQWTVQASSWSPAAPVLSYYVLPLHGHKLPLLFTSIISRPSGDRLRDQTSLISQDQHRRCQDNQDNRGPFWKMRPYARPLAPSPDVWL